jgi:hypothetical protein
MTELEKQKMVDFMEAREKKILESQNKLKQK